MDPLFCCCGHICGYGRHVKLYWESHPWVMIYDQIKPVGVFFPFFFFFSLLGGAVISWFSNSASFLWSPPFCGALRGSRGGDTHAHDMLRLTGGIPTLTLLHRYSSFPPGSLHHSDACTRPWSRNGDRSAVRRYCLLNGGVELQKPSTTGREINECTWHLFRITVSLVTEVWFSHTGILGEIRFSVQSFVINRFQAILVS